MCSTVQPLPTKDPLVKFKFKSGRFPLLIRLAHLFGYGTYYRLHQPCHERRKNVVGLEAQAELSKGPKA